MCTKLILTTSASIFGQAEGIAIYNQERLISFFRLITIRNWNSRSNFVKPNLACTDRDICYSDNSQCKIDVQYISRTQYLDWNSILTWISSSWHQKLGMWMQDCYEISSALLKILCLKQYDDERDHAFINRYAIRSAPKI